MNNIKHLLFLIIVVVSKWGLSQEVKDIRINKIDSVLERCNSLGIFNGNVLVAEQGKVLLSKGYGFSDYETKEPLSTEHKFYIGSITKQFTAMLIFQLHEKGVLSIHDKLGDHLKDFKEDRYRNVTLHSLLTHSSGMGNYTANQDFDKTVHYSYEDMLVFIKEKLLFKTGTSFSYSNSGYYLLGKIIEKVTGNDYGTTLAEFILKPLKMDDSGFQLEWKTENVAKGFVRSVSGIKAMPLYAHETTFSTGGMYSTLGDLYNWEQALYSNKLLSDSLMSVYFSPVNNNYACGWYVKSGYDALGDYYKRTQHGGRLQGYHCFMLRRIPQRQTIIVFDNYNNERIQSIKNSIWSMLDEEEGWVPVKILSDDLFDWCSNGSLEKNLSKLPLSIPELEKTYNIDEYDINKVAYRLMDVQRYEESMLLMSFNARLFPDSWNVYDSRGELYYNMGELPQAKEQYEKSLLLNSKNTSATRALKKIDKALNNSSN